MPTGFAGNWPIARFRGVEWSIKQVECTPIHRQQGAIAWPVLVKLRVRPFIEGMAIGGKVFLEAMFQAKRDAFPPKRLDGARKIQGVRHRLVSGKMTWDHCELMMFSAHRA